MPELTPEQLANLTDAERETWELCQTQNPAWVIAADDYRRSYTDFAAHARTALPEALRSLVELRAAVASEPHESSCTVWCECDNCEAGGAGFPYAMSPTCNPSGCDCIKSRLPK